MNLIVNRVTIEGYHERMFVSFFEIDSDFLENTEYFREDTISLGFKNEAERCSKELYDKYFSEAPDGYEETLSTALSEGASYRVDNEQGGTQFILGNGTYTREYNITLICTDEHHNDYEVIVAYIMS